MDKYERIEIKLEILVQIAGQYRSGRIPLKEAMERINSEMSSLRPAQYETVKKLFPKFLSLPYKKPEAGHPLSRYCEENSGIRSALLKMDEMEGEESSAEDWIDLYKMLVGYSGHIESMEKEFYPGLIRSGMRLQVEKARELGNSVRRETADNLERLQNGDIIGFLVHQGRLIRLFMSYLDLEERALIAKLLTGTADGRPGEIPFKAVGPAQNLSELFCLYPRFREDFFCLDKGLQGLEGPLWADLLKDSTVEMLAKSLQIDTADLLEKVNRLLETYQ